MTNQYQEIFRCKPWTYAEGSPVILVSGTLLRDTKLNHAMAKLQLRSLSPVPVVRCRVAIHSFAPNGNELDGRLFTYDQLRTPQFSDFGQELTVLLPNPVTSSIRVRVLEVILEDGSVYDGTGAQWEPLPTPRPITEAFSDPELLRQFQIEAGGSCPSIPMIHKGLFLCACGAMNPDPQAPCGSCGRTFAGLSEKMDPEYLAPRMEERLAEEEAARLAAMEAAAKAEEERLRMEAEKKALRAAKRKKTRKRLAVILPIVALVIALAALTPTVILPAIENAQAYSAAEDLLTAGDHDGASAAFAALGDYRDARDMSLECMYQKADNFCRQAMYPEAIELWQSLGGYSDSAARADQALIDWKDADYVAALALKDAGDYLGAKAGFDALEGYKDSAEQSAQCQELQNGVDYDAALAALERGDYAGASKGFSALGTYADALSQLIRTNYLWGCQLMENGDWANAQARLRSAGTYENAAELLTEATYHYGCQLLESGRYGEAITQFQAAAGYEDADKRLKDAKFGYCQNNPSSTDATVYAYMKELVEDRYKGAQALFDEIYAWKVTMVGFSNYEFSSSMDQLSKYSTMYCHFEVSGGEPGAKFDLKTVITMPGGSSGTVYHYDVSAGYTGNTSCWFNDPYRAPSGNLRFRAYDEKGRLLVDASVPVR